MEELMQRIHEFGGEGGGKRNLNGGICCRGCISFAYYR